MLKSIALGVMIWRCMSNYYDQYDPWLCSWLLIYYHFSITLVHFTGIFCYIMLHRNSSCNLEIIFKLKICKQLSFFFSLLNSAQTIGLWYLDWNNHHRSNHGHTAHNTHRNAAVPNGLGITSQLRTAKPQPRRSQRARFFQHQLSRRHVSICRNARCQL